MVQPTASVRGRTTSPYLLCRLPRFSGTAAVGQENLASRRLTTNGPTSGRSREVIVRRNVSEPKYGGPSQGGFRRRLAENCRVLSRACPRLTAVSVLAGSTSDRSGFFKTGPFVPRMQSSAIITLLKTDTIHERIFVGEAGSNTLRIFDWNRRLISSLTLGSPPTDLIVEGDSVLVLESGILDPNDQPKGTLVQYEFAGADSLRSPRVLIDSLFRPVFVQHFDFAKDGLKEFLICEFGNNRGRLALYKYDGSRYERQVLDPSPGAIRFEIRDMTGTDLRISWLCSRRVMSGSCCSKMMGKGIFPDGSAYWRAFRRCMARCTSPCMISTATESWIFCM